MLPRRINLLPQLSLVKRVVRFVSKLSQQGARGGGGGRVVSLLFDGILSILILARAPKNMQ